MIKKYKPLLILLILIGVAIGATVLLKGKNVAVFDPAGTIADKQRHLMIITLLLSVFIVVPVFIMTFSIVWKYREANAKAHQRAYKPDWDTQHAAEFLWWTIPCIIIFILAIITWNSTHQLDPYRPISSSKKPITVQVVALQWKWLFIYPEQGVASINYLQIPKDTPINFQITADAPMNSFWIPQLGGQVYAMEGMTTKLHLMATKPGDYKGSSANLSGKGFAGMDFDVHVGTDADFTAWIDATHQVPHTLDAGEYAQLAKPSEFNPHYYYQSVTPGLYDTIVMKFMAHGSY